MSSCNPIYGDGMATNFCTCHDSSAVMACAKFCNDRSTKIWIRATTNLKFLWKKTWWYLSLADQWDWTTAGVIHPYSTYSFTLMTIDKSQAEGLANERLSHWFLMSACGIKASRLDVAWHTILDPWVKLWDIYILGYYDFILSTKKNSLRPELCFKMAFELFVFKSSWNFIFV